MTEDRKVEGERKGVLGASAQTVTQRQMAPPDERNDATLGDHYSRLFSDVRFSPRSTRGHDK